MRQTCPSSHPITRIQQYKPILFTFYSLDSTVSLRRRHEIDLCVVSSRNPVTPMQTNLFHILLPWFIPLWVISKSMSVRPFVNPVQSLLKTSNSRPDKISSLLNRFIHSSLSFKEVNELEFLLIFYISSVLNLSTAGQTKFQHILIASFISLWVLRMWMNVRTFVTCTFTHSLNQCFRTLG